MWSGLECAREERESWSAARAVAPHFNGHINRRGQENRVAAPLWTALCLALPLSASLFFPMLLSHFPLSLSASSFLGAPPALSALESQFHSQSLLNRFSFHSTHVFRGKRQ